jgi:hypothetical protein
MNETMNSSTNSFCNTSQQGFVAQTLRDRKLLISTLLTDLRLHTDAIRTADGLAIGQKSAMHEEVSTFALI